jgi:hypothetical protein
MKHTGLIAVLVTFVGVANASTTALLERNVDGSSKIGDLVSLTDGKCRYMGKLVRLDAAPSTVTSLLQAAGADAGRWHIAISQKACGELSSEVSLRVNLLRSPSLVGGGGIPPEPVGYLAGTRFTLLPN